MKIFVKGQPGEVELTKNHYKASGGLGDIYIRNGIAYKIYQDPKNSLSEGKINELSVLDRANIIKPENIILDQKSRRLGYTMRAVPDNYVLVQLFPKIFKTRNNVSPDQIAKLVHQMQETIQFVHSKKILIVDLNEMNFLVDKTFKEVYFIDVDSYQTPSYPATAIMDSIKDRHASHFSEGTDWFSFAVVSYWLFRGIHPYRNGTHPSYRSMEERMLNNISVLNPSVNYPSGAALPDSVIPDAYKVWYKAVLEEGKRLAPPTSLVPQFLVVTQPTIRTINGNLFDFVELDILSGESNIGDVISIHRTGVKFTVITDKHVYRENNGGAFKYNVYPTTVITHHPKTGTPIAGYIDNGLLKFNELITGNNLPTLSNMEAESLMEYNGRVYYKHEGDFIEISFIGYNRMLKPVGEIITKIAHNSTQVFPGCLIENLLGSYYITIFPANRVSYQLRTKELDGYAVVEAKYDNGIAMIVGAKLGKYDRFVYVIDKNYRSHDVRVIKDINYVGLNFVTLDNGICVSVNEDDSIEVFSNNTNIKRLTDSTTSGIKLMKDENRVIVFKNNKFYQLKMR